ncbi:hypothetical protein KUV75_00040 [Qipengyuania gaetbuli]|uniref:hypothetical protein n=1 Tax=Qipengyuania gaetbuli TaxID=266952 RepID=UPI001C9973D8|nr:hypothetical protein [Qipengyuania gaetbuli]MBY6013297.1 hypothetical protein [Qipengyuania gaetbuli]
MKNDARGDAREIARARARDLFAHYPSLSTEELVELKHWFGKTASSLDVAMLSMDEGIEENYDAFRAEHIDRITLPDVVKLLAFWVALAGVTLTIVLFRS